MKNSKLFRKPGFSRPQLLIFCVVFALVGYLIFRAFAAPNPNLQGDLNNDNVVNISDLSILLSNYGTSNSAADINSDGSVNILDLSVLLSHYGQTYTSPTDINVLTQYGSSDSAIRSAITAAQSQGKGLYFPAGTYHYSNILNVSGLAIHGDGVSSLLIPDNHDFSSIKITGYNPSVSNLKFQVSNATTGGDGGAGAAVWLFHATNAHVDHITSSGTQGPPIFDEGSTGSVITNNNVINSTTGGIAFVAGASNADVSFNTVHNCSDDMISVVSDMVYSTKSSYISIHDNTLSTQNWGRGIAVVGGDHITVKSNNVSNTFGSAIYIVVEGNYNTYGNSNIVVDSNTVRNPDQSNTHNANILVGTYQSSNTTINVSGANNNLDRIKPGVGFIGNYSNATVGWFYGN
jgi:hypothetical protein